jgi:hypothetical protein
MNQAKQSKTDKNLALDATLKNIVKGIDPKKSIVVHDPGTHEEIRKQTKNIMVQSLMRLFEQNRIRFPETDKDLIRQLHSYVVLKVSAAGEPVYGSNQPDKVGDHIVAALYHAVWSLVAEYSSIGGPNYQLYYAESKESPFSNPLKQTIMNTYGQSRNAKLLDEKEEDPFKVREQDNIPESTMEDRRRQTRYNRTNKLTVQNDPNLKIAMGKLAGTVDKENENSRHIPYNGVRESKQQNVLRPGHRAFTGPQLSKRDNTSKIPSRRI